MIGFHPRPLPQPCSPCSQRNIVDFVPYNKFKRDPPLLAREVLKRLPGQLTSYMMSKGGFRDVV